MGALRGPPAEPLGVHADPYDNLESQVTNRRDAEEGASRHSARQEVPKYEFEFGQEARRVTRVPCFDGRG